MLELLLEQGIAKGFFELSKLGQLEKSCCLESKLEVIDFDNTKVEMVAKNKIPHPPKSADALKILSELNCIDFIELKGFKEFLKRDKKKDFKKKIEGFKLDKKIKDSLLVLELVVKDKSIRFTTEQLEVYLHTEKNYLIVVDIELSKDPIKDRMISLIFLSLTKSLNDIQNASLHKLNKPKLLSCNEVDPYYQSKETKTPK